MVFVVPEQTKRTDTSVLFQPAALGEGLTIATICGGALELETYPAHPSMPSTMPVSSATKATLLMGCTSLQWLQGSHLLPPCVLGRKAVNVLCASLSCSYALLVRARSFRSAQVSRSKTVRNGPPLALHYLLMFRTNQCPITVTLITRGRVPSAGY